MNKKYEQDVAELIEWQPGTWAWIRRRASHHYSRTFGHELEGSSDVSGHVYRLWEEYQLADWEDRGMKKNLANMGFWINGQINVMLDIPDTKATREYHNSERA
jgi:hypothetical protein